MALGERGKSMDRHSIDIADRFYEVTSETVLVFKEVPWNDREFYASWLAQQYFLVEHTTRLLCAFSLRVPLEQKEAYKSIMHHLKEESGHDQWLLNDLKKLGYEINQFRPLPEINAIIKSQYYEIDYNASVAFIGYSQFLEVLAVQVAAWTANIVDREFGRGSAVFLRGHAEADVEHVEEGFKRITTATDLEKEKILENLITVGTLYNSALVKLKKSLRQPQQQPQPQKQQTLARKAA